MLIVNTWGNFEKQMLRTLIIFMLIFGVSLCAEHPSLMLSKKLVYELPKQSVIDLGLVKKAFIALEKPNFLNDSQKEIIKLTLFSLVSEVDLKLLEKEVAQEAKLITDLVDIAAKHKSQNLRKLTLLSACYLNAIFKQVDQSEVNQLFTKSFTIPESTEESLYHSRELGYYLSLYIKGVYTQQIKHTDLVSLVSMGTKLLPENLDLIMTQKIVTYNLPIVIDEKNVSSKKLIEVINKQLELLEADPVRSKALLKLKNILMEKDTAKVSFEKPFYKKYRSLNVAAVSPKKKGLVLSLHIEQSPKMGLSTCEIVGAHGPAVNKYLENAFLASKRLMEFPQSGSAYTFQFDDLKKRISGSSASLGMAMLLLSAEGFISYPESASVTGAVSRSGIILEVGGLVKKIKAAIDTKQKYLIIPQANKPDLTDFVIKYGVEGLQEMELLTISNLKELPKLCLELEKNSTMFKSSVNSLKDLKTFSQNVTNHESARLLVTQFNRDNLKYSFAYSIEELKDISHNALTNREMADEDILKTIKVLEEMESKVDLTAISYCRALVFFLEEYLAFRNEKKNSFKVAREKLLREGKEIDLLLNKTKN
ncbi:MAG: hypothetical protein NE330_11055 [Lentisphaeraceae bacterium]|nr:hypothetical protein [Lentisphaeraceae bacterium]